MIARIVVALVGILIALPVIAGELTPEQARHFVLGKLFSFHCFEGTDGAGRVYPDGSVAGTIRLQGAGPVHYVVLPPGTLRVKDEAVCASMKGLFFEPCFNLVQTDDHSFRGSVSGFGFASCQFTRRGGRTEVARATSMPLALRPAIATTVSRSAAE